ncbi:MAG TPA: mechanosensitive ion channel family protein [Polyangia bacterium]|jgi:small-conductance mechanosensitive channel/CRP-like cAMP-binding protein
MHSHLAQEWAAAWPLPAVAVALLIILSFLRAVVDPTERGRVKAGIFFAGTYLVMVTAFGVLGRPLPAPAHHDWMRVVAVLLLCFAFVIAASLLLFEVALKRREMPRILRDLVQALAYFVTSAIVLTRSDVDVTRVFAASVLTTAVIGLALQDTLGNVMAGLALQLERDFEVGDWINVGDRANPIVGRIREVRWRATTIVTRNGDLMLIPNSAITRAMLTNFSRPTTAHRQWVYIRVHFRHPPARVREVVVEAVRALSFVRAEPAPDCLLWEFREDASTYACRYWMDDIQRDDTFDSDVRSAVWYALHRAGMEIPFPSRNINVTEMNEDRVQRKLDEEYAQRVDALSRVDVFRALDAEKVDRLARRLRHVVFGPGEVILRQGDPGDSLYLVRGGQVVVQIGVLGASKEIATLGDGEFFGEMSLMTGESRTATVVAKTDVECYIVEKEAFQEIVHEKPDLAGTISDILSQRQVVLGAQRRLTPVPSAAHSNQLRSKIAAFFGLGGGKR